MFRARVERERTALKAVVEAMLISERRRATADTREMARVGILNVGFI